jgi:hypothetical protein
MFSFYQDEPMMKTLQRTIVPMLTGYVTFQCFLALIGILSARVIGSGLFGRYVNVFCGTVQSVHLRNICFQIFWIPFEAVTVVLVLTAFSFFSLKPDRTERSGYIMTTLVGALLGDIVQSVITSGNFMSYFPVSLPFPPPLTLILNITLWSLYSHIAYSLVVFLRGFSDRVG